MRRATPATATQTLTIATGPVDPVDPEPRYQPDGEIRTPKGNFVGARIYAVANQRVSTRLVGRDKSATFKVRVRNRGNATDRMTLRGTPKNAKFRVRYLVAGDNVTSRVTAGTYVSKALAAGSTVTLTVKVIRRKSAEPGDRRTFKVRAVSVASPTHRDTVAAVVKRAR